MKPVGSLAASEEYLELMQPILTRMTGQEPRTAASLCHRYHPRKQQSPYDESFFSFILASFDWSKKHLSAYFQQQQPASEGLNSMNPTVQLMHRELLSLPPFSTMLPEKLAQIAVGVSIPSWLAGTETACLIADAAERAFGRLVRFESSPSAAYTAAGYELCRISHEAFECSGPGRLMTLELEGELAVATMVQTPVMDIFESSITFAVRRDPDVHDPAKKFDAQNLVQWVNAFVDGQKVDILMLAGPGADDPLIKEALKGSKSADLLDDHAEHLPAREIVALGTAQAAKDAIESQIDDCGEPAECEEIRRESDRIAGKYKPPARPSRWPASPERHSEL